MREFIDPESAQSLLSWRLRHLLTFNEMPAERTRASNPQGRQKACSECAKGKRRCDLQQPACSRCSRLSLTCIWPSPSPYSNTSSATNSASPAANNDSPLESMSQLEIPSWPSVDMADMPPSLDSNFLDLCLNLSPSYYDLGGGLDAGGTTVSLSPYAPSTPSQKLPSLLAFSPKAESRISYSMTQWEKAPLMMVRENCTFWSHPKLYEECMPSSMADAYATCALSMARTKTNARFIARHITHQAYKLIESPMPTQPLEILARGHALLLYMILMICSGDFRCFAQVQTLVPHLETSATAIFHLLTPSNDSSDDPPTPIPTYPSSTAQAAWTSFIFRESCRRTLLVLCHAVAACHVIVGDVTSCLHELGVGNRITISAALWSAASPVEFAKVWNEQRHWLVRDLDFKDVLRDAGADDLDVFGRMILVGTMGIDDVRGWLHMRGAEL